MNQEEKENDFSINFRKSLGYSKRLSDNIGRKSISSFTLPSKSFTKLEYASSYQSIFKLQNESKILSLINEVEENEKAKSINATKKISFCKREFASNYK